MQNILFVQSSPADSKSFSNQYASHIVADLAARHPGAKVIVRNVAKDPIPHIGEAFINGRMLAPEKRNSAEAEAIALSDVLIDELVAADVVVFAVPMHNFSIPSSLKAWIDHIARAGRTFAYTEKGPEGLLKGKKAVIVVARGGSYAEGPAKAMDFQEPYLRTVLGFIGITNVKVVRVEGVALGEEAIAKAKASAQVQSLEVAREMA